MIDDVGRRDGIGDRATVRPSRRASSRLARAGPQADHDGMAGVVQVERVGAALAAVADDGDGLPVECAAIDVAVVVGFHQVLRDEKAPAFRRGALHVRGDSGRRYAKAARRFGETARRTPITRTSSRANIVGTVVLRPARRCQPRCYVIHLALPPRMLPAWPFRFRRACRVWSIPTSSRPSPSWSSARPIASDSGCRPIRAPTSSGCSRSSTRPRPPLISPPT